MKLITNPLETSVEIGIKGNQYIVEPLESLKVSDEVAELWKKTHEFLIITEPKASVEDVDATAEEILSERAAEASLPEDDEDSTEETSEEEEV